MTEKPKVVVTNPIFAETKALLEQHAMAVINTAPEPWPYEEVRARCGDATGILAFMTDRIDDAFVAACPRLRVIGAALKGADNIDVQAATDAGVWLTIVPDLLTVPTAELAIGLMLSLGRNIVAGDRSIKAHGFHGWRAQLYGSGLAGATVGIVGFGLVGRAIAERLTGFQLPAACPRSDSVRDAKGDFPPCHCGQDFEELLAGSDYVVLALPLTDRTQHIVEFRSHRENETRRTDS